MRKISIYNVQPGMVNKKPILGFLGQYLLNAGIEIKPNHIYYLKQMGVSEIYIHDDNLADIDFTDPVESELRSDSRAVIARVMKDLDASAHDKKGLAIREKDILTVVSRIVEALIDHRQVINQFSDIRMPDGYIFAHSVNCCIIATMLGVKLNYDIKTLRQLAIGALLHDIGFVVVPQMILKKPDKLTDEEYEAVKKHPQHGYDMFRSSNLYSQEAGDIILQHHERCQGQGYPRGIKGEKTSELAQVVSLVDVYDALTSEKYYRDRYYVHEAIEMILGWGEEVFNPRILKVFLNSIAAYPVGTHVLLSNGDGGVVIENTPGYAKQPLVRLLYKRDLTPHPSPYNLDLKKVKDLHIARVIDDGELLN
ncbi:MAG: HD-GYP domain-containing protein [Bacillota bacterium]